MMKSPPSRSVSSLEHLFGLLSLNFCFPTELLLFAAADVVV